MSKLFYSPKLIGTKFKIGGARVSEEMNSFSTQPKKGQGKLTRKGLYGEIDPYICKLLERESFKQN